MFKEIVNSAGTISRVARTLEWATKLMPGAAGDQLPQADSMGAGMGLQHDLSSSGRIEYGQIVDAIPMARCYRVQPGGGGPTIDCAKGMGGTVSPIGAYDADTLTVGTYVRFMQLPGDSSGLIISTEPTYMHDPSKCLGDTVSQGSNTSLKVESGLQEPLNLGGSQGSNSMCGGITDWSGRSPFDSLEIGEFNRSSELGLMLHMDSYMAFMRADEYTGIWAFYWDGLCRVAGQNFQGWEGPSEREVYDDEGETVHYQGVATYPWEHRGQLTGPADHSTENTSDETQNNYPYYGRIEPYWDDLQAFHRFREYAGYLGQGQKKLVCNPILTMSDGTFETEYRYGDTDYEACGLHEQQITMGGRLGIRSALGITIAKYPIIPVPKRNEVVTSEDGDTPSNYKASDYYGTGSSHKCATYPPKAASIADDELHLYRANVVLDLHAHLFNWEGQHPFYYHEYDYELSDESEYEPVYQNQEVPEWDDLNSTYQWYLDVPTSDEVEIDHRTGGTAEVFRNMAYMTFTDEGGVSIGDGWGSEIRMAGGSIFLECPGDVFMAPGRNVIAWGGRDICLRAWNCVDISANKKDVRIKAEQNLNMLGGNGGEAFGVFIESRGSAVEDCGAGKSKYAWEYQGEDAQHTGIVMKAKNSEIVGWARNVYLMTRMQDCLGKAVGSDICGEQPKVGDIVLDTKGKGDIITRSSYVKHWVQCAVMHAWPESSGSSEVNFFTQDGATLCRDVYIDGDLLNYGSHLVRNDVISCQGHFFSAVGGTVGKADTGSACSAINQGHAYEATLRGWAAQRWAIDLESMWYSAGRPGNPAVVKSAWVDMRIEEDYVSEAFTLFESRWQQMARLDGAPPAYWTENVVESNSDSEDTYPFPGRQRLTEDTAFRETNLTLWDTSDGWAENRGSTYEKLADGTTKLGTPAQVVINGYYGHIGK